MGREISGTGKSNTTATDIPHNDAPLQVYLATRVFSPSDRLGAEFLDTALLAALTRVYPERRVQTYVPFRDGSQRSVRWDPREIYERNLSELRRSAGVVAMIDGLAKDEGVCMEIGYAFAMNLVVVLGLSDFFRLEDKRTGERHLVDPVLHLCASEIVELSSSAADRDDYRASLKSTTRSGAESLAETACRHLVSTDVRSRAADRQQRSESKSPVYIDFGGGLFEWEREAQTEVAEALARSGVGCTVASRYSESQLKPIARELASLASEDLDGALSASVVVTSADSAEMSSGTAVIQGAARALGKTVILLDSKRTNLVAESGYRTSRNLMIDQSATRIVERRKDVADVVIEALARAGS